MKYLRKFKTVIETEMCKSGEPQKDVQRIKNVTRRYRFIRAAAPVQMIDMRPAAMLRHPAFTETANCELNERRHLRSNVHGYNRMCSFPSFVIRINSEIFDLADNDR